MEKGYLDLAELQAIIKDELESAFPERVKVKAEISALQARANGHCYMELSQSEGGRVVAKARAVCWRNIWLQLSACFEDVAGSPLKEGMTVLAEVSVSYSELYGFTLVINDIDPAFTLGERELKRQMTIKRLESEGLIDMQKELAVPSLPYRIAVISAPDAAGYRDFCKHIESNEYGFKYSVTLFPAAVQGDNAPRSVADALGAVEASETDWDCVLLMRGGGSKLDLACFDEYEMAAAIARCPYPVLTGIGHDQDFHIADMVACMHVKTPTALADWLIELYAAEDEAIAYYSTRLRLAFLNKVNTMAAKVDMIESRILSADPRNILKRGYTLTLDASGKVVRSASAFSPGDTLRVLFPDGEVNATVKRGECKGQQ